MRRLFRYSIMIVFITISLKATVFAQGNSVDSVELRINGTVIVFDGDNQPLYLGGEMYLPLRHSFSSIYGEQGGIIDWAPDTKTVMMQTDSQIAHLHIDSKQVEIDGLLVNLNSDAPIIINNRTYVSTALLSQTLNMALYHDTTSETVYAIEQKMLNNIIGALAISSDKSLYEPAFYCEGQSIARHRYSDGTAIEIQEMIKTTVNMEAPYYSETVEQVIKRNDNKGSSEEVWAVNEVYDNGETMFIVNGSDSAYQMTSQLHSMIEMGLLDGQIVLNGIDYYDIAGAVGLTPEAYAAMMFYEDEVSGLKVIEGPVYVPSKEIAEIIKENFGYVEVDPAEFTPADFASDFTTSIYFPESIYYRYVLDNSNRIVSTMVQFDMSVTTASDSVSLSSESSYSGGMTLIQTDMPLNERVPEEVVALTEKLKEQSGNYETEDSPTTLENFDKTEAKG